MLGGVRARACVDAEPLYRRALATKEKLLGQHNPALASSLRNASAQLGLLICGKSGYAALIASFTEGETGVTCHSRPRGTPIIGEKCTVIDAFF
jgi:hypothetical protein